MFNQKMKYLLEAVTIYAGGGGEEKTHGCALKLTASVTRDFFDDTIPTSSKEVKAIQDLLTGAAPVELPFSLRLRTQEAVLTFPGCTAEDAELTDLIVTDRNSGVWEITLKLKLPHCKAKHYGEIGLALREEVEILIEGRQIETGEQTKEG